MFLMLAFIAMSWKVGSLIQSPVSFLEIYAAKDWGAGDLTQATALSP
jgi:hypothetical protein